MNTFSERLYRRLLLLLPRTLRNGFEDEMASDFLARLNSSSGWVGKALTWTGAMWDLGASGLAETISNRSLRRGAAGRPPGSGPFDAVGRDLRFAARTLRRSPSFTLVAVFTLALGIGATTVSFSLVKGVLLRPLPFSEDQELVVLGQFRNDLGEQTFSFPNFEDLRSQTRTFEGIAALRFAGAATVLGGDHPARGTVVPVSREFFSLFGTMPFLGRPILPEENRPGGEAVAVVGHEFWSRSLGSEEELGSLQITISGRVYSVVGVMPPGFKVLEEADVYLPLEQNPFRVRDSSNYLAIGRLAEGVTLAQAQVELDGLAGRIREANPEDALLDGVVTRPLREEILGSVTRPLYLLMGASFLLLLLACSNVASTLMARSLRRQREMAIRMAVGGGRGRLVRLAFTEGLLLALLSGAVGVGLTLGTLQILRTTGSGFVPRLATVSVDAPVLIFALGATLLTSLLFGLLPALRLPDPAGALRGGSHGNSRWARGGVPGKRPSGWSLLVGGQVALAVSLVVASGLLLRSMREILSAEANFQAEGVLTVALDLSTSGLTSPAEAAQRLGELKAELGGLPGVMSVGMVSYLPTTRSMMMGGVFRPPWPDDELPEHVAPEVGWRVVDEDYFRTMGIPLLKGRFFGIQDRPESQPVIILNEPVEKILFQDRESLGSLVGFAPFWNDTELEVVGVVAEARDWRVSPGGQMEGYVYWPQRFSYARFLTVVLRTSGNPEGLMAPARERLRAVAPNVPGTFRTMESLVADSFRDRVFTLGVLGVFALLSLFLSAVGIYGVVSFTVSAQAREIGIRLALGAQRGEVRSRIFLRSSRAVALGLLVGVGVAYVTGGVLESLLFQVQPRDPVTLALAPLVLLTSASLAIAMPVIRYTRIDPVNAMREE